MNAPRTHQQDGGQDWIQWEGGECPVDPETVVCVRTRRQEYMDEMQAGNILAARWLHAEPVPPLGHIIAYRVVSKS